MSFCERFPWLNRRRVAVGGCLAAALIGGTGWAATQQPPAAPVVTAGTVAPPAPVLVFVSGAVVHPGLYQLSPDARVADAIAAAGGMTGAADPGHEPDLASRVHDGRQINVPFRKSGSAAALKLDINSASEAELAAVPGMPPGLATAIVQFRVEWGPLASLSQLRTDLGVDAATVAGLGHYLRVVAAAP